MYRDPEFRLKLLRVLLIVLLAAFPLTGCPEDGSTGQEGAQGPPGPEGEPYSPTTSAETCDGCHDAGAVVPVADITDMNDAHYVDTDVNGPLTPSGYRDLVATITSVDLSAGAVSIDFSVVDDTNAPVTNLFASDGRFAIARLDAGSNGDANDWVSLITRASGGGTSATAERFTTSGGSFSNYADGTYTYTSVYDPTTDVAAGDTVRVAIQLSASDIPPENAWCDFDADTSAPNTSCSTGGTTVTRDITQTVTCNVCHGATNDTRLSFHGGGRTDVEYCVTCHNPTTVDSTGTSTADMKVMIHALHRGADLPVDPSSVHFTKDIDDCTTCHTGSGVDVGNWATVSTREACGSCHNDVDFDTGAGHEGGVQLTNVSCVGCHPKDGAWTATQAPVETVHVGVARTAEAARYRAAMSGMTIESLAYAASTRTLTVDYSVGRDGAPMDLAAEPEWTSGGALSVRVAWTTAEYTNAGSDETPAQPLEVDALPSGAGVEIGTSRVYRVSSVLPSTAADTITVTLDGRASADLDGDGAYTDRIAIKGALESIDTSGGRTPKVDRRGVVDVARCNACHDSAGAGISLHGNTRTSEIGACVTCHNPDATDINVRPADPGDAVDGKREESIDMKRMIHQIHAGATLENGVVYYGYRGSVHDFSDVDFIGNLENCESCHLYGTYSTQAARDAAPSTLDTGADASSPDDDLNVSPTAAVCSSCHDSEAAITHMELNGASFHALDADIL